MSRRAEHVDLGEGVRRHGASLSPPRHRRQATRSATVDDDRDVTVLVGALDPHPRVAQQRQQGRARGVRSRCRARRRSPPAGHRSPGRRSGSCWRCRGAATLSTSARSATGVAQQLRPASRPPRRPSSGSGCPASRRAAPGWRRWAASPSSAGGGCEGATTCQLQRTQPPRLAVRRHAGPARRRRCSQRRRPRSAPDGGSRQRGDLDAADRPSAQHPGQPVDVVGVEVGQHQQRDPAYAEPAQAAVHRGPGRDPCPRPRAVPDPAFSTSPSPWPTSQATSTQPPRRPARTSAAARAARPPSPRPTAERAEHAGPASAPRHERRPPRTARSARRCRPARRPADRGHRQAAHACTATVMIHAAHQAAGSRDPAGRASADTSPTSAARQPEHGGRTDGRGSEQVRDDRHQADLSGDRRPPAACRPAGRRAVPRSPRPPTAAATGPAGRASPGPSHRMPAVASAESAKPGEHRQPRVDQQQEQHRGAERPRTPTTPVGAHPEQRHRPHHRRPQDARLRCGPAARTRARPSTPTTTSPRARTPDPPGEQQQRPDHQGQVGARDREQVGQARGPEGLGELARASARRPRRRAPAPACADPPDGVRPRPGSSRAAGRPPRSSDARAGSSTSGGPRVLSTPARSASAPAGADRAAAAGTRARACSRPSAVARSRAPAPAPGVAGRAPRPSRCGPGRRRRARSGPARSTGSEVTTTRASTEARSRARASTGGAVHRLGAQQHRGRHPAAGDRSSATLLSTSRPRRRRCRTCSTATSRGRRRGPRPERRSAAIRRPSQATPAQVGARRSNRSVTT